MRLAFFSTRSCSAAPPFFDYLAGCVRLVFFSGFLCSLCSTILIVRVPSKAMACGSNTTALLGKAALFVPGYDCSSSVAPSHFGRLISGYRLLGGPLLGSGKRAMVRHLYGSFMLAKKGGGHWLTDHPRAQIQDPA